MGFATGEYPAEIGPLRRAVDALGVRLVDWVAEALVRHWLLLLNAAVGLYWLLPIVAPGLMALGASGPAGLIYAFYSNTCHQMPSRSYFIFGYQMAHCQRETAIYLAAFLAGLLFAAQGRRWRPLRLRWYLLLIAPMAVDGFSQLFGWRESDWLLRGVTGALFGAASVWLTYPYLHRAIAAAAPPEPARPEPLTPEP